MHQQITKMYLEKIITCGDLENLAKRFSLAVKGLLQQSTDRNYESIVEFQSILKHHLRTFVAGLVLVRLLDREKW